MFIACYLILLPNLTIKHITSKFYPGAFPKDLYNTSKKWFPALPPYKLSEGRINHDSLPFKVKFGVAVDLYAMMGVIISLKPGYKGPVTGDPAFADLISSKIQIIYR